MDSSNIPSLHDTEDYISKQVRIMKWNNTLYVCTYIPWMIAKSITITKKKKVTSNRSRRNSSGSPVADWRTSPIPPPARRPWSMWYMKHWEGRGYIESEVDFMMWFVMVAYLWHAITCVNTLPTSWVLFDVEFAEIVECNDSVEIDHHTCHQHCHY